MVGYARDVKSLFWRDCTICNMSVQSIAKTAQHRKTEGRQIFFSVQAVGGTGAEATEQQAHSSSCLEWGQ